MKDHRLLHRAVSSRERLVFRALAHPKDALPHSRTFHTFLVSLALHLVIYFLLAAQWVYRVSAPLPRPLLDDAAVQVVFIAPKPIRERAVTTETAPSSPAQTPAKASPAPPRSEAKRESRPAPKQERREREPARPAEPHPPERIEPPKSTPITTAAKLLPEDPSPLAAPPVVVAEISTPQERTAAAPVETRRAPAAPTARSEDDDATGAPTTTTEPATAEKSSPDAKRRAIIGQALDKIVEAATAGDGPRSVDIVFLLDISGSMSNNIRAVADNLGGMMRHLESKGYDATFGVVKFAIVTVRVFPQSRDAEKYVRLLDNIKVGGDERALNALDKAAKKVRFRGNVQRRFVLITDEPLKGSPSLAEALSTLQREGIIVDVIGLDIPDHRHLARSTGGTWHLIPGEGRESGI